MIKLQEQRYHGDLDVNQAIMRLNLGKSVCVALYDSSNTIVIDCQVWGADDFDRKLNPERTHQISWASYGAMDVQAAQSMALVLANACELVRQAEALRS